VAESPLYHAASNPARPRNGDSIEAWYRARCRLQPDLHAVFASGLQCGRYHRYLDLSPGSS